MAPIPKIKTEPSTSPVRTHIEMLHHLAAGLDGVLVVSAYNALSDSGGTITRHPVGDVDGMVDSVEAHSETANVNCYVGLQVMRRGLERGKRGKEHDIVAVLGLVVDLDADTGKTGNTPIDPNLVLETSPGNFQPFILFDRPLLPAEAKPLAAALRRATGSDHGTADVCHVWRIPGTLNWPNRKKLDRGRLPNPADVTIVEPWDGTLTNVDDLRAALEPWMSAPAENRTFSIGDIPDVDGIEVSPTAAYLLAADDVGDRSAHAARVVERLAFDSHTAEEALALFLSASGNWFDRYQSKDPRVDFERNWQKFGQPHVDAREHGAALAAGLSYPKEGPEPGAANDNHPTSETVTPSAVEDEAGDYVLETVADLESLTYPGGLVEDVINWIVASAEQPSRTLAMAAALPMVAALMGPRYSTGNRDTRPNIYAVALAESGFGKEHARSQIKRLIADGQGVFDKYSGPARIMSASALREVLEASQSVCCQVDEFGGFIRDITDRKAGGHQRAISTDLRDYYSASSTFFEGAAYRGNPPKRIYNPNLCIHGTSTPEQFWSALSSASAEDGLLPRLILFNVDHPPAVVVKPERDVRWVSTMLVERMADVAGIDVARERGNIGGLVKATKSSPVKPHVVPWDAAAQIVFEAIKSAVAEREKLVAPEARPFVRRIVENALKLALINAVGIDHVNPVITEDAIEWGAALAWSCAAGMLAQVTERLSDNQREANYKKIAGLIRKEGRAGITEGRLADRCKAIDARQREEIVKDLLASDFVRVETSSTGGRPRRRLVWAKG